MLDDVTFSQFLRDQERALAAVDRAVGAGDTNVIELVAPPLRAGSLSSKPLQLDKPLQIQVDSVARRLADGYMACDDEQRADIRRLVESSPAALAHLGIAPDRIKLKIDSVYFRFALIYESMKDLRPELAGAITRIDALCQAARAAGIDPNASLKEIAAVSSSLPRSGQHSMRSLLLQRIVLEEMTLCPLCGKRYPRSRPGCPHCAADPRRVGTPEYGPELLDDPISDFAPIPQLIRLPTLKVLGLMALSVAASAFAVIGIVLAIIAWVNREFYYTWKAWISEPTHQTSPELLQGG
jgi:hypothetical protein